MTQHLDCVVCISFKRARSFKSNWLNKHCVVFNQQLMLLLSKNLRRRATWLLSYLWIYPCLNCVSNPVITKHQAEWVDFWKVIFSWHKFLSWQTARAPDFGRVVIRVTGDRGYLPCRQNVDARTTATKHQTLRSGCPEEWKIGSSAPLKFVFAIRLTTWKAPAARALKLIERSVGETLASKTGNVFLSYYRIFWLETPAR